MNKAGVPDGLADGRTLYSMLKTLQKKEQLHQVDNKYSDNSNNKKHSENLIVKSTKKDKNDSKQIIIKNTENGKNDSKDVSLKQAKTSENVTKIVSQNKDQLKKE